MSKTESIRDLKRIPGVGPSLSEDLYRLGFSAVSELKGRDPQVMYEDLMKLEGCHVDRCVLYVFRCAVYFANETTHDPERLKWWNWKDQA
ncbi:MAG: helix-hairpin-helix domain-containing protein [Proteobacteria bacterium]|nr:helix-hairpin-helix domain-containing protein [Pseudomonadota bacterium]